MPATATDDTTSAAAAGLNTSDIGSSLTLRWPQQGSLAVPVSYYLAGFQSSGLGQGAFINLAEADLTVDTPATKTPWIAFVSCDSDSPATFTDIDIFALAKSKGAVAGLLYTDKSSVCILNEDYAGQQPFDIFTTQSRTSAQLVKTRFDTSDAASYDAQKLDDAYDDFEEAISTGYYMDYPGYLYAELKAYNSSSADPRVWTSTMTALPTETSGSGSSSTVRLSSTATASGDAQDSISSSDNGAASGGLYWIGWSSPMLLGILLSLSF